MSDRINRICSVERTENLDNKKLRIKIRVAKIDDAIAIANLHTESWKNIYKYVLTKDYLRDIILEERKKNWRNRLCSPKNNQYVLVAESNETIIGFACVFLDKYVNRGSYLENLHVDTAYHSKGIGKSLLLEIAQLCNKKASIKSLCLLVNQDNANAQNFYLHLGANNLQVSTWNAPDGSIVPTYCFLWDTLDDLIKKC